MVRLVEAGADVRYVAFSIATKSLPDGFPPDTLATEVREAISELGLPESNLTADDFEVRTFPDWRQDSRAADRALGGVAPGCCLSAQPARRPPGPPGGRGRGLRAFSARPPSATRFPGQLRLLPTSGTSRSSASTSSARWPRSPSTSRSSTVAAPTPMYVWNLARMHGINVNREYAEVFQVSRVLGSAAAARKTSCGQSRTEQGKLGLPCSAPMNGKSSCCLQIREQGLGQSLSMDPARYHSTRAGRVIRVGRGDAQYFAFRPLPIPEELTLSHARSRARPLRGGPALGRLTSLGGLRPNPHILIQPYLRREAVASTRIEGTQSSLSEVLSAEAQLLPDTWT